MINTNDEIQAKIRAEARQNLGGALHAGYAEPACARTTLRERVAGQLQSAEYQIGKAQRLSELLCLLDKNPDTARILDLLEEMHG